MCADTDGITDEPRTCADCTLTQSGPFAVILCRKHAATDDLLAAAELMLDRITDGRRVAGADTLAQWALDIRAAIAKATGQAVPS
jgi:hypothetical protein